MKFIVPHCQKISKGNPSMLCFRKFPVAKKFMDKRGGGVSTSSIENFLSHSDENFGRGGGSFSVSLIVGTEKVWIREGGVSRFSVEVFVSLYRNISLKNTLVFQKIFLSKIFMHRRGGHHGFVETFCLTGPKRKAF